jgi:hypothetical protein
VKDQKPSPLFLVLALLVLLVTGILLWPVPKKAKPMTAGHISASSHQAEEIINRHLWMTDKSRELAQEQMKAQNTYTNPRIGDSIWPEGQKSGKQMGVDHSPDTNENNAYQDLNRYPKNLQVQTPDAVIQAQLSDEDRRREYEAAYREEYAKQFIENARRNGYEVLLNDQFVVISVRPIRNPSGELGPQAQ